MANAARDANSIPTLLGVSSSDGTTPIRVYVDPVTHRLLVDTGGVGGGIAVETPTGTVNGANTVFTATNEPIFVVADGMTRFDGVGYTLTGSGPYTITFNALIPPVESIRSVYNA